MRLGFRKMTMKIRFDFVTNSSSTSFVIICNGEPCREDFIEAMGIKKGTLLEKFMADVFESIRDKLTDAEEAIRGGYWGKEKNVYELIKKHISDATAIRAEKALEEGKKVWIGSLDSGGEPAESFFCCECVEADHLKIYINALNCAW